jgi:hypothetical protein
MVAGAGVLVDAEALAHDALPALERLATSGLHAALLVQHGTPPAATITFGPFSRRGAAPHAAVAHLAPRS